MIGSCPCQSGLTFSECCQPFIEGHALPQLPEQLMRSRFSAHVTRQVQYIIDTYAPDEQSNLNADEIEQSTSQIEWLGLQIVDTQGNASSEHGIVEFKATYRLNGREQVLQERSSFRKVDGRWYYVTGNLHTKSQKIGRNEACPCGSGKKYKKCCINSLSSG